MTFHRNIRFACCNLDERMVQLAWKGGAPMCSACEARALELLGFTPPD